MAATEHPTTSTLLTVAQRDGLVAVGDLASFRTVASGTLKVKVVEIYDDPTYGTTQGDAVLVVTGKATNAYPKGYRFATSPLHLAKRSR